LDKTAQAKQLAQQEQRVKIMPPHRSLCQSQRRRPRTTQLSPARGNKEIKLDVREVRQLAFGEFNIDLDKVEQLIDRGQTHTLAWIMVALHQQNQIEAPAENIVASVTRILDAVSCDGLDSIMPYKTGYLAMPRLHEIVAAINRMRNVDWLTE
jgi:hypothetical protein